MAQTLSTDWLVFAASLQLMHETFPNCAEFPERLEMS